MTPQAGLRSREPWRPPAPEGDGPEVVLLGEALVAFLAADALPLRDATTFRRTVVGSELNVASGLARLGHDVLFCGRTGTDALGEVVLDAVRGRGVRPALVTDPAPTGILVRDVSASRPVQVDYARAGSAGSRLTVQDLPHGALAGTRVLHLSGITASLSTSAHEACAAAVEQVRQHGGIVSFDPNLRRRLMDATWSRSTMLPLVARSTILLAGLDELAWLSGLDEPAAGAAWALDQGVELVVVKDGARGAWARDRVDGWSVPARPVTAVDPVGAGDAFAAGLLSALLRDADLAQALTEAAAVAALVVGTPGDVEGLPDRALLERVLAGGDEVHR